MSQPDLSTLPPRPQHIKLLGPPCDCKPVKLTVLKQVEESTTNFGAFYYKCATETCRYFKWATDSGNSIDYGDLWAPCCLLHPNRKCKLLQIARNSINRGKLFWICGVLDTPCTHFQLFEGNIDDYKEFVPNFDESLLESQELESSQSSQIVMSQANSRNMIVSQLPEEIMAEILKYLDMIPNWVKIIGVCKEWKRMIDNVIDQKVNDGLIELNLGFLHSKSPFWYFCEIFKRFYKVRKITICNFELYSELMRLLEWVGVETLVLYNCTTKMSCNQKDQVDDSDKVLNECFSFRSKCTEMSFFHIHGETLLYNFNHNHVVPHLNAINSDIYFEFVKEMERKVDITHRRQFQELSQIIAINCPEDLNFVWLNGPDARSYHKHEQVDANYGDLLDLPFEQEELENIGKCHVNVYSLPTDIDVGFLNLSLLGHHRTPKIYVKNGKKYSFPTVVDNQVISHPEIQKQFIRNCGISKYFNINLLEIVNKEHFDIAVESGILHFENVHKHASFKICLEILAKNLLEDILKVNGNERLFSLWKGTCVYRLVYWIYTLHSKGLVKPIPSSIIQIAKSIDSEWKQRKLLYSPVSKFYVDYSRNIGAIRVPFSWEAFVNYGELRYLFDESSENSNTEMVEKNVNRRTSNQFDSLNQPKKRKLE